MLNAIRYTLATSLLITAIVGLMPLLPRTFGFESATVTNDSTGTFFPNASTSASANRFIYCRQSGASAWTLKKNTNFSSATNGYFQCTNNWNTAVSFTLSLQTNTNSVYSNFTGSSTSTSIAPGATACIKATFRTANSNIAASTVVYKVVGSASDLYAEVYFTGSVQVAGAGNPTTCTPIS